MTGWFIAAAIWLLGIKPMYEGVKYGMENDFQSSIEEQEPTARALIWASIIFWPISELLFFFSKDGDHSKLAPLLPIPNPLS